MLVHPLRSTDVADVRGTPAPEAKVAVLLNARARRVSERVIRALSHVVPDEDLFVSHDLHSARAIARTVVARGYPLVFTGGGDGTFVGFLDEIFRALDEHRSVPRRSAPRFGILKLGTGNGLATLVNASPLRGDGILDDVLRARQGDIPGYRALDLILVDGKRAPFAGLGADAKLLSDYEWVKENLGKGVLRPMLSGPGGYITSVALRTAPHFLSSAAQVECEIFNGPSGAAYRLNRNGSVLDEIGPGELLFRGRAVMCAAATIPFYGFGLRMFPFATSRRGMMHLRIATNLTTAHVVANLPRIWRGKFHSGMLDFHAREFTARFDRPVPLQIGGDFGGQRSELTMSVASEPLEVIDFSDALH